MSNCYFFHVAHLVILLLLRVKILVVLWVLIPIIIIFVRPILNSKVGLFLPILITYRLKPVESWRLLLPLIILGSIILHVTLVTVLILVVGISRNVATIVVRVPVVAVIPKLYLLLLVRIEVHLIVVTGVIWSLNQALLHHFTHHPPLSAPLPLVLGVHDAEGDTHAYACDETQDGEDGRHFVGNVGHHLVQGMLQQFSV